MVTSSWVLQTYRESQSLNRIAEPLSFKGFAVLRASLIRQGRHLILEIYTPFYKYLNYPIMQVLPIALIILWWYLIICTATLTLTGRIKQMQHKRLLASIIHHIYVDSALVYAKEIATALYVWYNSPKTPFICTVFQHIISDPRTCGPLSSC